MLRRHLLPVLLVALVAAASAAQAAGPAPVTVAAGSGRDGGWTAVTVQSAGGSLSSTLTALDVSSPVVLSGRVYVDGALSATTSVSLRASGGGRGVSVHTQRVGGVGLAVDQTEDDSGFRFGSVSATLTVNPDGPVHTGRVSVVLYVAATAVGRWDWTAQAAHGTAVLGARSGAGTFLYTPHDFDPGQVSAEAGAALPVSATAHVRANRDAVKALHLGPATMASYTTFGTDHLTVTGPGYARTCAPSCDVDPTTSATSLPGPGQFEFHLDGSSVGVTSPAAQQAETDVLLHGATVTPPAGNRL